MTGKPIAKDRFDEIGIAYVDSAKNFKEATRRFDEVCMRCHIRKEFQDCGGCPVRATILANADNCMYKLKAPDYVWLEMERSSC